MERLKRITLRDDATGALLAEWWTDEEFEDIRKAITEGSAFGLAAYESRAAYEQALKDED